MRCQGSKWNLRRHAFQRHDLFVPDDGEPWRPPTETERHEMMSTLEKRKGANEDKEETPNKQRAVDEAPSLQPPGEGPSLKSSFDPDGVLRSFNKGYDALPSELFEGMEEEEEESAPAVARMVSTIAPAAAAPIRPVPATGAAVSLPLVCATPDQVMSPQRWWSCLRQTQSLISVVTAGFWRRSIRLMLSQWKLFRKL